MTVTGQTGDWKVPRSTQTRITAR